MSRLSAPAVATTSAVRHQMQGGNYEPNNLYAILEITMFRITQGENLEYLRLTYDPTPGVCIGWLETLH